MKNNKNKKHALIVGGSGGIGRAVIQRLIRDGYKVSGTYHNKPQSGVPAGNWHELDVTDLEAVKNLIAAVGTLDALVFCPTAPTEHHPIVKLEWQSVEEHWRVQVAGFFYVVKALLPQMKTAPVRFVAILTEYVTGTPPAGLSDYISAKYALMGFCKSMAIELAKYGCTVNMVSPGMTDTELLAKLPPKMIELEAAANPQKRIATPEDVANAVSFFLTPESGYLNGVNIFVNGGGQIV